MAREPLISALFQVALTPADVKFFDNPSNQPEDLNEAINCGAVSGQLLGLYSKWTAEVMTEQRLASYKQEWITELNREAEGKFTFTLADGLGVDYRYNVNLDYVRRNLFTGYATLLMFDRVGVPGHSVVGAYDSSRNFYILDAQARRVYAEKDIPRYLIEQQFVSFSVITVEGVGLPKDAYISLYTNIALSGYLKSACALEGGRKRKRKSTRKLRSRRKRKNKTRKQ